MVRCILCNEEKSEDMIENHMEWHHNKALVEVERSFQWLSAWRAPRDRKSRIGGGSSGNNMGTSTEGLRRESSVSPTAAHANTSPAQKYPDGQCQLCGGDLDDDATLCEGCNEYASSFVEDAGSR